MLSCLFIGCAWGVLFLFCWSVKRVCVCVRAPGKPRRNMRLLVSLSCPGLVLFVTMLCTYVPCMHALARYALAAPLSPLHCLLASGFCKRRFASSTLLP